MEVTARNLGNGAILGFTGAVSIAVIDSVIARAPILRYGGRTRRIATRLAIAGLLAYGTRKVGAPVVITEGIVAGAVLMSTLDIFVWSIMAWMPLINPPPVIDPKRIGEPWPPQPLYTLPGTAFQSKAHTPENP